MSVHLKVTNEPENHNGYQFKDGPNFLQEKFNNNPNDTCGAGFHVTTKAHVHDFYTYGTNVRVVELPDKHPDFKMVVDPSGDKIRTNMIILKEKYSLGKLSTYSKLGIKMPTLAYAANYGFMEIVRHLCKNEYPINERKSLALRLSAKNGHFDVVTFLVTNGADISANDYEAYHWAVQNKHEKIAQYLKSQTKTNFMRNMFVGITPA